jgi:hypothetical protein
LGSLKGAIYARMEEMSFRSGAAVGGGAIGVAGVAVTLAVVLSGHTAAATSAPSPDAAGRLATPVSSAPAPVTSAASSGTPRSSRPTVPRAGTGSYSQSPSPHHVSATPRPSAPRPSASSAHTAPWQPRPPKWTPGDPRRPSPPDWGWPG